MPNIHTPCPPWFQLERYKQTTLLDFEGWKTQIGNRIYLQALISSEQVEVFDTQFAEIAEGPFHDLGFSPIPLALDSIYPLTIKRAQEIILATDGFAYSEQTARIVELHRKLTHFPRKFAS